MLGHMVFVICFGPSMIFFIGAGLMYAFTKNER